MIPGAHSCPACGSPEAVSKAVAWDAAATVPPKTADRLRFLEEVFLCAADLVLTGPHSGDEHTVVVTIRVDALEALRDAISA